MAERIPRAIIPRSNVSVPNVGNIRVQSAGRLDGIPRPATARIKPPVIRNSPPPVTSTIGAPILRTPEMEVIQYETPTSRPAVSPRYGGANGGNKDNNEETEDTRDLPPSITSEQPVIDVPFVGEIPVPPYETVVLSGTTAVATVAATLIGKDIAAALLKWMKPIVKQVMLKLKKALNRDLTDYETQELLVFEGEKKLMKLLKKEQKQEKLRQATVQQAPPRQRIQMRMEKKDGNRPQP